MGKRLNNTKINRNVQAVSLPFLAENLDGPEAGFFECHGMPRGVFLYFSGGDEHPAALGQACAGELFGKPHLSSKAKSPESNAQM